MSPFPTERGFIPQLIQKLAETIIDEVKNACRPRNSPTANTIEFLLRGTDEVFLEFQTRFHRATQRQQIILAVELEMLKINISRCARNSPVKTSDSRRTAQLMLQIDNPDQSSPTVKGEIGIVEAGEILALDTIRRNER